MGGVGTSAYYVAAYQAGEGKSRGLMMQKVPEHELKALQEKPARRKFLQTSLIGGVAAAALPMLRPVLEVGREGGPAATPSESPTFEFDEITITELQEGMKSGEFTARSVTEKYLRRIEAIDKRGPDINCVIEINPDALEIAEMLDKERREKRTRGPLHGVPLMIKDNIDTADRMMTTAGSLALVGAKPPKDSFVAQKLRQAGAVILGKTNLSEWANMRSNQSTSGWSGRGGLTKNPYALDRNPCGSSSGSAAGVSANLCAGAIGTETDGSIVCPSSANGIVGIKPTVGLVSRSGIIPISHSQDGAGPMCRTVRDAAIMLGALTGVDQEDGATSRSRGKSFTDYTQFLTVDGLEGARIGVVRGTFGFNQAVDKVMETALDTMKQHGAILVDPAEIKTRGQFDESESTVFMYELKADLNAYLARLGPAAPVHSLKEIIDFNERHQEDEMPYFGQELFIKAEGKGTLSSKEYLEALKKNHLLARTKGIDAVMDKSKLDALVGPTGGPAWLTDLIAGDHFGGGSSGPAAVAGYPNINVPAGFVFGLPVGISFFGRAWSEPVLIRLAYGFEQATKARKAPRFLASMEVKG
ncbi:MAG TPA: amidase [Candidatus Dormibacteraeota bacterium]|nr:amidase [Candidatus Dormibacteraeota bacterium]